MALVHPMMGFMNLKENGWESDTLFWHLRGTSFDIASTHVMAIAMYLLGSQPLSVVAQTIFPCYLFRSSSASGMFKIVRPAVGESVRYVQSKHLFFLQIFLDLYWPHCGENLQGNASSRTEK